MDDSQSSSIDLTNIIEENPNNIAEVSSSQDRIRLAVKLSQPTIQQDGDESETLAALVQEAVPDNQNVLSIEPLIVSPSPQVVAELVRRAAELDPTYEPTDFSAWYLVEVEPESSAAFSISQEEADASDPDGAAAPLLNNLNIQDEVDTVHPVRLAPPPATIDPSDDPRSTNQGYLDAAPTGIDARYAWDFTGGDGAGIGFVDLERGWNLEHEDLIAGGITLISGSNRDFFSHGTSVLGEVLMTDNSVGGVGIAPGGIGRVVSQWQPNGYNTAAAIIEAASTMEAGDVLLLEAQTFDPTGSTTSYLPVEVEDATYEAIRLATGLGITVVEAGANGGYDLDTYVNGAGDRILDRSSAGFRDSGAILVGAASSGVTHERLSFSNYGSRVDVYGWGRNVDTTATNLDGNDNTLYTAFFSGTSSASPIISGAGLIVQGLLSAQKGSRFSPAELRAILIQGGTPSLQPDVDRIGVLPNLKAIIEANFMNDTNSTNSTLDCDVRGEPQGPLLSPEVIIQSNSARSVQNCKQRCLDTVAPSNSSAYVSPSNGTDTIACEGFSYGLNTAVRSSRDKSGTCTLYSISPAGYVEADPEAMETFFDVDCDVSGKYNGTIDLSFRRRSIRYS